MKKIFICAAMVLVLAVSGCSGGASKTTSKTTKAVNSTNTSSNSSSSSSSSNSSSSSSSSNSSSSNKSSSNTSSNSTTGTSTTTDNYQPPAKGGKAMANEAEAVEIAREFLNISKTANYKYNIKLVEDYYVVNFEVYFDDGEKDECGCKVNAKGFYAYDPVG